jgi:GNAT superfamily N-acetyltransferase
VTRRERAASTPHGDRHVVYRQADRPLARQIVRQWRKVFAAVEEYIILENGFTVAALRGRRIVGVVSAKWQTMAPPLGGLGETYIWYIEVAPDLRRQGIATGLLREAELRAAEHGDYQLRAWSSSDKVEALHMWAALGYGLCPGTVTSSRTGERVHGYWVTHRVDGRP